MTEPEPVGDALENRVTRLEQAISDGLTRIEELLRQSIGDLKAEQIKDLKDNYLRLADDQRRLWDAVRDLEKSRNTHEGSQRVWSRIWNLASAGLGGSVVAAINWVAHSH